MRPEFDQQEEFLIAYYRQYRKADAVRGMLQDGMFLFFGAAFFGLGCWKGDIAWLLVGFAFVSYLGSRSLLAGKRYNTMIAHIIEKYEAAMCRESNKSAELPHQPS